ncbi:MAG: asparaginase domain-containing protein, partial [Propionibacteriaceae bacterium]|nr:asparaginase domain-containing protein [Propionibacteriaceae bacterium]
MIESPRGLVPGADLAGWITGLFTGADMLDSLDVTQFERLIDSSNATPDDWQAIVDDLWAHRDAADAFVVLSGTDTMAFTSAALSYALTAFGKPVVVTGSQQPLTVVGSDAGPNVNGALRAATSGRAPGVSLFFGHRLLAGARATKMSSWSYAGFDSPNVPPLAITGAPWSWNPPLEQGCGWP